MIVKEVTVYCEKPRAADETFLQLCKFYLWVWLQMAIMRQNTLQLQAHVIIYPLKKKASVFASITHI